MNSHPCSRLLCRIIRKWGISITNNFVEFWTYKRIKFILLCKIVTSIEKRIHFSAVCMNIKEKYSIPFVRNYLLLDIVNLWMKEFTWKKPLTIYIISRYICTIIPTYNTIYINHRNDSKLKILSKFICLKPRTK